MSIVSDSYVSFQNTDKKKKTSSQKFEDAEKGTQSVYEEALKEDKKKSGLNNWVNSMGNSKVQNKVNKRRAQFNMYANDLDNKVKQMVVNSFDCEADYVLQQEIATLYAKEGKASIKTKDLVGLLEKQGYKVSRESIKATYRSDFKGSHNGEIREGHHVTVLTVTDPETGAEIKIADSNGNAEIEIEEVFLNELIDGISADIDGITGATFTNTNSDYDVDVGIKKQLDTKNIKQETDNRKKVTESEYQKMKEDLKETYIKQGMSTYTAVKKALEYLMKNYVIRKIA